MTLQTRLKHAAVHHRKQLYICWDNFDYQEEVHHLTLKDRPQHVCATTGLFLISPHIPPAGINVRKFIITVKLRPRDVFGAPGIALDQTEQKLRKFFLLEALRYAHPAAVNEVFAKEESTAPVFPIVDRLLPSRSNFKEMGPILANEGTLSGTYEVTDIIALNRLGLKLTDAAFEEHLTLSYGDQKTVSLVQSMKRDRRFSSNVYGRYS